MAGEGGKVSVQLDLLNLPDDAVWSQVPPLPRREVGGHLGLRAAAPEPLDQVQVVELGQPQGQVHNARVAHEASAVCHSSPRTTTRSPPPTTGRARWCATNPGADSVKSRSFA